MLTWFHGRTRREQVYLLIMGVAISLWLLLQLVVMPATQAKETMALNNQAAAELLMRVDSKATRLIRLRSEQGQGSRSSLTAAISRASEQEGLPVRRLQPNSRGEVQVRFESVDYDNLVRWLYRLETGEGLLIIDASIVQAGRSGGVNATLRVADPG
ncbi:MAG: type II secretion system protein M [Luminiphilus sp.]|nr:type II secretion system protein M [Luminiphilus sp.]